MFTSILAPEISKAQVKQNFQIDKHCTIIILQQLEVLEYIEPMCIEAHLEAHVLDLYISTHLGLEEYTNNSLHYGIISLG